VEAHHECYCVRHIYVEVDAGVWAGVREPIAKVLRDGSFRDSRKPGIGIWKGDTGIALSYSILY
jgi:hypothetical protein